jgi:hypothetical protein
MQLQFDAELASLTVGDRRDGIILDVEQSKM